MEDCARQFKPLYQFCQTLRSQLQLEAGAIRPTNIGCVGGGRGGGFEAKLNHIKTVLTMTVMYHSLPKFEVNRSLSDVPVEYE